MNAMDYFKVLNENILGLDKSKVVDLIALIEKTVRDGASTYVFGNGGSGANASHFVQDLLKCPVTDLSSRQGRYKAICFNDNTPVIMAWANDLSYEEVFKQQLMNFCQEGDLVIGISGSGKSINVIKAFEYANSVGATTFAIVGFDGGNLLKVAKESLHIKTDNMQIYEDMSMASLHAVITALKHG